MNIHSENISSAKPTPVARHLKPSTEEIKFATGKSELGAVLVARSAAGVCAILIGDGTEVLKRDLAEELRTRSSCATTGPYAPISKRF
jgi:AraC family transcriptional regulator of adaptative response/methylated-DNA-[protein]-cysteine methyltransferase